MMRKKPPDTKSRPAKRVPERRRFPGRKSATFAPPALVRPPLPGQGKRGESGYLGYLLRQAQAASRLSLERALSDLGATPAQFVVLTMLKAYPGLSGADLARVALLTPQTVSLIIRNLERGGAIRKTPHPVHGRVLQWSLTPHGLALLQKCRAHAMTLERKLMAGMRDKELRTIRLWLSKIAENLQD